MKSHDPAPDARGVRVVGAWVLHVVLEDGRAGPFDVAPLLAHPAYEALRDPAYFAQASIVHGVVTWPSGEDLAPEKVAAGL